MTCERYRRTHFVEVRPCCSADAAALAVETSGAEVSTARASVPQPGDVAVVTGDMVFAASGSDAHPSAPEPPINATDYSAAQYHGAIVMAMRAGDMEAVVSLLHGLAIVSPHDARVILDAVELLAGRS